MIRAIIYWINGCLKILAEVLKFALPSLELRYRVEGWYLQKHYKAQRQQYERGDT